MYTNIKEGTEIALNLEFAKIGLLVDTAPENRS